MFSSDNDSRDVKGLNVADELLKNIAAIRKRKYSAAAVDDGGESHIPP